MARLKRRFTMKLELENAAFFVEGSRRAGFRGNIPTQVFRPGPELARIFTELAVRVKAMDNRPECRYPITDVNGNLIGEARIT